MNSNNEIIRKCFRKCCMWGRKKTVIFDQPYEGGPTPLWRTVQQRFFIVFSLLNIVFLVALIVTYITWFRAGVDALDECLNKVEIYFIITILMMGSDAILYLFMASIHQASDQEWNKYICFLMINFFTQFVLSSALVAITAIDYYILSSTEAAAQTCNFDEH